MIVAQRRVCAWRVVGRALSACLAFALCLASAAPATAASWRIVPSPGNGALSAVSCTSARVCTAVGVKFVDGSNVPLAERWNGTSWSIQRTPTPAGATFSELIDVSCTSRTFCIAVGSFTNSLEHPYQTFVERWNGSEWSIQPIPKGFNASGVSCTSNTACSAVGGGPYTDGLIQFFTGGVVAAERWDGSRWSIQQTPELGPSGLSDVSCASQTACVAVGYGVGEQAYATLAERWNGITWAIQRTPTPGSLEDWLWGVSCPTATACTAVGAYVFDTLGDTGAVVERWNGTAWSIQSLPSPSYVFYGSLNGVSCASMKSCVAVGSATITTGTVGGSTVAADWDGSSWSIQQTDNPPGATGSVLNGISCTSTTACTAVGSFTNSASKTETLVELFS
jgi:hypothetical protein